MGKTFDKPITIQRLDQKTKKWDDVFKLHARINKARSDNEYLSAGATQSKKSLTFEVRYFKDLEAIDLNLQLYRILYRDVPYDVKDYDDFMQKHESVKILGVSY